MKEGFSQAAPPTSDAARLGASSVPCGVWCNQAPKYQQVQQIQTKSDVTKHKSTNEYRQEQQIPAMLQGEEKVSSTFSYSIPAKYQASIRANNYKKCSVVASDITNDQSTLWLYTINLDSTNECNQAPCTKEQQIPSVKGTMSTKCQKGPRPRIT